MGLKSFNLRLKTFEESSKSPPACFLSTVNKMKKNIAQPGQNRLQIHQLKKRRQEMSMER